MRFPLSFFVPALLAIFLFSVPAFADETSFYTLNERWAKNAQSGKTKDEALGDTFTTALANRAAKSGASASTIPTALPITRTIGDVLSAGNTIEVEHNQTLFLRFPTPVLKFLATDDGVVTMDTVEASILRIVAIQIGSTFIHVWDESGRKTFTLRVVQPKYAPNRLLESQAEILDRSRSFKFSYDNSRGAFYSGDKYREMRRTDYDFNQRATIIGDTPYGELSGHVQTQNDLGLVFLTDTQVALRDGKVGNLDNFNLALGDSAINSGLMIFPQARVRGAAIEHWDDAKRVKWSAFRGREQSSVIGTITPGLIAGERTLNSYLTGQILDFKLNDQAVTKVGYFQASGRDRLNTPTKNGVGAKTAVALGEHVKFETEFDHDTQHAAQKHAFLTSFENFRMKNEVRDVSKKFFTLLGNPGRQGEIGFLTDASASPFKWWTMTASVDIFRDRLIFNPADPSSVNIHTDFSTTFTPSDTSSLIFTFQDIDDTGRIGPTKIRTYSAQYNQRVNFLGHKASIFTRYQNRNNRSLTNPFSDYMQDQFVAGFYTEIFWGINFSMQKEWSLLREPATDRRTHPNATIYSLDYLRQISDLPLYLEARLRIRDEEETESPNSFMAGEDTTEFSGGLRYRPNPDFEVFLNGSFTQYVPEDLDVPSQRVEAQFLTGMHYVYDTGWRWSSVGAFKGYVFKDLNGDGTRQPGESGIPGIAVSSDGKQAVTDENGFYELKGISGRKAVLTIDNTKFPYGYAPTSSTRQEFEIEHHRTREADFGLTPRSEVSGIVFSDLNGDGKYQSTDAGVRRVKIVMEDGQATRSNSIGVFTFPNVVAGPHRAELVLSTLPEGYLPMDVPKKEFTTFEGIRYEINFPLKALRLVTGRVFLDTNKNGVMDMVERPAAGVKILLGPRAIETDAEGYYLFEDVPPGSWRLAVDPATLPAGYSVSLAVPVEMTAEPRTMSNLNIGLTAE